MSSILSRLAYSVRDSARVFRAGDSRVYVDVKFERDSSRDWMEEARVDTEALREDIDAGMDDRWEEDAMMERWDLLAREWRARVVEWEEAEREAASVWVMEESGRDVKRER